MCLRMHMLGPGQAADKGKRQERGVGSWRVELVGHAADRQGELAHAGK